MHLTLLIYNKNVKSKFIVEEYEMGRKYCCVIAAALVLGIIFTGCGKKSTQNGDYSGSITAAGSTALQPLVEQAAEAFNEKYPYAIINVQGGGSGTGLSQVAEGAVDIGNSDIFANEKSGIDTAQMVDHKVCVVGIAVIANKNINIDSISKQQLIEIFTGKIKNWKEIGGPDLNIILINRSKSSGTRKVFKKYALDDNEESEGMSLVQDSNGAVKNTIISTKGTIGYMALPYLTADVKQQIKILKFDNIEPSVDNITSGRYSIWAYEHMYTRGEAKTLTKSFIDYISGSEGKKIISGMGYIPVSDMKVTR
jgi:phosphate transport system substrate-binding protein